MLLGESFRKRIAQEARRPAQRVCVGQGSVRVRLGATCWGRSGSDCSCNAARALAIVLLCRAWCVGTGMRMDAAISGTCARPGAGAHVRPTRRTGGRRTLSRTRPSQCRRGLLGRKRPAATAAAGYECGAACRGPATLATSGTIILIGSRSKRQWGSHALGLGQLWQSCERSTCGRCWARCGRWGAWHAAAPFLGKKFV